MEGPKKERTVTKQNICTSVPPLPLCLLLKLQIGKPVKQFNHGDTPAKNMADQRKKRRKKDLNDIFLCTYFLSQAGAIYYFLKLSRPNGLGSVSIT